MNPDSNYISLIKSIVMESADIPDDSTFTPEMYYFIILNIMDTCFDFYSEDIFRYMLFKGHKYFSGRTMNDDEKTYLTIFENELKTWNNILTYTEFDDILLELMQNEKNRIIESIKKEQAYTPLMEKRINSVAVRINRKYKQTDETPQEMMEKLFDMFD